MELVEPHHAAPMGLRTVLFGRWRGLSHATPPHTTGCPGFVASRPVWKRGNALPDQASIREALANAAANLEDKVLELASRRRRIESEFTACWLPDGSRCRVKET